MNQLILALGIWGHIVLVVTLFTLEKGDDRAGNYGLFSMFCVILFWVHWFAP